MLVGLLASLLPDFLPPACIAACPFVGSSDQISESFSDSKSAMIHPEKRKLKARAKDEPKKPSRSEF